jgi:hypothetical protein
MNLASFLDELVKLGAAGHAQLGELALHRHLPTNSIGRLVRQALAKRASDLSALHDAIAPTAVEVNPADVSTRLPDGGRVSSLIRPGGLGAITPSADPIDRERFNRAWNQPPR